MNFITVGGIEKFCQIIQESRGKLNPHHIFLIPFIEALCDDLIKFPNGKARCDQLKEMSGYMEFHDPEDKETK